MRIPRSSSKPLSEAPMVSLADIAFLIIFFFLATSNFMKDPLSLSLPVAEKKGDTKATTTVVLGKDPKDDAVKIFLNNEPVDNAMALEGRLKDALKGFSEEGKEVRVRCDKKLTYKDYGPVLTAIGDAGGIIAIIHEEK